MSLEGCRISIIEDDPIMGASLVQSLCLEGCQVNWWKTGHEALNGVAQTDPDLVVCDIRLPDTDGEALFLKLAQTGTVPPFLFVTGFGSIDQAVSLIRNGAADYITKPFEMSGFISRVESLVARRPNREIKPVLGVSEAMRRVEDTVRKYAAHAAPVLITGETGVGKEVCAKLLHHLESAKSRPFMAVNCAAIPAELLESEVFGHEKGAFSGAVAQHKGYAERAGIGTLFLDEIADLPLHLQAKLLRLIEDRQFTRLGGEDPSPFKARIVCATNANLQAAITERRFREDLYYRINVMAVAIPPLRSRVQDIPWLMKLFLESFSAGQSNSRSISALAEQAALAHPWPGNARELRNRMERALLMASGPAIMPCDLFPERGVASQPGPLRQTSLRTVRDEAERQQIEWALKETGGQVTDAARLLDVSRTTLWEKMKRLGITIADGT